MESLHGRVAIVTGASRGLGHALAHALAAEGAKVGLCARSPSVLDLAAQLGPAAFGAQADVRDPAAMRHLVQRCTAALGPVDILVNNAGIGAYKPLLELSEAEVHATLDVNVKGTVFATQAVLPGMLERGRGDIVNIASDLAARPLPNMAVYVASKHAVRGFSTSLLREVKDRGVRVTCVNPGIIDTYFGGSEPGRDPAWSLRPEVVARAVINLLRQPRNVVLDELTIHPVGQDF